MKNHIIQIYYQDKYQEIDLSKLSKKEVTIGNKKQNDVTIEISTEKRDFFKLIYEHNTWFIKDPSRSSVIYNGRNIDKKEIEEGNRFEVAIGRKTSERLTIIISNVSRSRKKYAAFEITDNSNIFIGKDKDNHLEYDSQFINDKHFRMYQDNDKLFAEAINLFDIQKKSYEKCVYVNGVSLSNEYQLKDKDIINFYKYEIIINIVKKKTVKDGYPVEYKLIFIQVSGIGDGLKVKDLKIYDQDNNNELTNDYEIQSRIFPNMPADKIVIPNPPKKKSKPDINWLSVLLPPALMMIVFLVILPMFSNTGGGYGVMFILFSGITVITTLVNYFSQRKNFKKDNKRRLKKYNEVLDEKKILLNKLLEDEKQTLYRLHSNYEKCFHVVENRERRLWERSFIHKDFLDTKLGIGNRVFGVNIEAPKIDPSEIDVDDLIIKANKIKEAFSINENVPISVDLKEKNVLSLLGNRDEVLKLLRSMVIQLATNHSYKEVKFVFVLPDKEKEKWEWIRWFPHVWDASKQHRYIASTKEEAKQMLLNINEVLKKRGEKNSNYIRMTKLPHYIFFIANRDIIQNNPIVSKLVSPEEEYNITSIFALEKTKWVPQHCKCEIRMDYYKGEMILDGNRANTQVFKVDDITKEEMDEYSREIAPIKIKNIASSVGIPNKVSLFEILEIDTLESYRINENWKSNKSYASLKVPIGKKMGDEIFNFDIHEKEHGPHGLIAGTTGSGKSETLLTFLISLAANYHPHDVGYILIDYKGGGLANDIKDIPHLLGTITNLDDTEIQRSLLSIKSELKRRQRIFEKYQTNHIDSYQKMYKEGIADEPIPHLLLIVDEFAELKVDQPEFMTELVSAARIGRSLGLHLVLSTQKPSGVVDEQIWSNSRFKICLKVSTPGDSQEVLKKSDASYITLPGRAYIQVGNDEVFELFQSAYANTPYQVKSASKTEEINIYKINDNGSKTQVYPRQQMKNQNSTKETELNKLVDRIIRTQEEMGIKSLDGPWRPALRNDYILPLSNVLEHSNSDYRIHYGIYDAPSQQAQGPLYFELANQGSTAIYGVVASGKTTLLQTMITYSLQQYCIDEMHIYIADFGSRILKIYEHASQVGGVILSEELERFDRLISYLEESLNMRKNKFAEMGVTNIQSYNIRASKKMPAIVIYIDNIDYLKSVEEKDYHGILEPLLRQGANYGVYFIVTVSNKSMLSYKMANTFSNNIALRLNEKVDYTDLLSYQSNITIPKVNGRGYSEFNNQVIKFQGYIAAEGEKEHEITENIIQLIKKNNHKGLIFEVPKLEDKVYFKDYQKYYSTEVEDSFVYLGVNRSSIKPVGIDLKHFGGFIITGGRKSGISTSIEYLLKSIINIKESGKIILFDNYQKELYEYADYDRVQYIDISKKLDVELLEENLTQMADQGNIFIHDYSYFIKMVDESIMDKVAEIIDTSQYTSANVFIGIANGRVDTYDAIASAVKKVDMGIALGHKDESLSLLDINISYEERRKRTKVGQGTIKSVNGQERVQLFCG